MKKINNRGLTLIELLISVVIFAMLIVPVMNQLMQSLEMEQKSKRKQYETEYIEGVMEYFKNTNMKVIESDSQYNVSEDNSDALTIKQYESQYFTIWKKKGIKYLTKVVCDPNKYTTNSSSTLSTLNDITVPNAVNIDDRYCAVINKKFCNYDVQAAEDVLLAKVDKIKDIAPNKYQQWKNGVDIFPGDKLSKSTTVYITKASTQDAYGNYVYSVKCVVSYIDSRYADCTADYTIYNKTFKDKDGNALTKDTKHTPIGVPSVYIMYSQYVQDDGSIQSDDITIDTGSGANGLLAADKAKVYLLRNTSDETTRKLYRLKNVDTLGANTSFEAKDGDILEVSVNDAYKLVGGVSTEYQETRYYLNGKRVATQPAPAGGNDALSNAIALVNKAVECTSSLKDYRRGAGLELGVRGDGTYASDSVKCYTNMYTSTLGVGGVENIAYDLVPKGSFTIANNFKKYSEDTNEDSDNQIYDIKVVLYKAETDDAGVVDESTLQEVMTLVSSKEGN